MVQPGVFRALIEVVPELRPLNHSVSSSNDLFSGPDAELHMILVARTKRGRRQGSSRSLRLWSSTGKRLSRASGAP